MSFSYESYRKNLLRFYNKLMYNHYMSNKREIARQDVILTPEGPVELYRRDTNGTEKVLAPRDYEYIQRQYKPKVDFNEYLVNSYRYNSRYNRTYDTHTSNKSRMGNSRHGRTHAFDWYDKVTPNYSIIDERVQVLSNENDSYDDRYERPYIRRRSYSTKRGPTYSRNSGLRRRSNSRYDYDDDRSYDSSERRGNPSEYDVYEYYEYDDDYDSRSSRSTSSRDDRYTRDYSSSSQSIVPTPPAPPIPPERRRKRAAQRSYVEYDNDVNYEASSSSQRQSNESSSRRPHLVNDTRFEPRTERLIDIDD